MAVKRADPNRLYWNVQGAINCGEHAPFMGSDTWEWQQWHEVPRMGLIEWFEDQHELMDCEVCGKNDSRETGESADLPSGVHSLS